MLTILEGSTFVVSDELGDVGGGVDGVYADDTRMLSRCRLGLDGSRLMLLSGRAVDYFSATHYLRNRPTATLPADSIFVARERFVGEAVTERIVVRNEGSSPVEFELGLELAADFADILTVKAHDFAFGDPLNAPPLPPEFNCVAESARTFSIKDGQGYVTTLRFSQEPEPVDSGLRFGLSLPPHHQWELAFEISFGPQARRKGSPQIALAFGTERQRVREALAAWKLRVPHLQTAAVDLQGAYERSIADLASLRLRHIEGIGELPAAGMPWFMTVFGRDTLITSLQTLLFGPELAIGALRALAGLQAHADNPDIDAEPGKILHELRRGKTAAAWFPIYYGSIDATPLFLVLLSEVWRWTRDPAIVRELEQPARAALDWIDAYGDRDGDGFIEYERRSPRGLENQSWKDSGDSQRFRDGQRALPPIAPAEAQGYVYDARRRSAELAREVWADSALAKILDARAESLQRSFNDAFWLEERGSYALALDRDKQPVDALCSNIGHLLWSDIVTEQRRPLVAQTLVGSELYSGWGVRTMGAQETAYNPLSYHNGTVWPHDTALAAWGLARAGYTELAHRVARNLIEAAPFFDYSLPEVFAGFARDETAFPVAYPTAARPQAWAAGTPVLCLTLLLGLRPDHTLNRLTAASSPSTLAWLEKTRLGGVPALGQTWQIEVENSAITVHPT